MAIDHIERDDLIENKIIRVNFWERDKRIAFVFLRIFENRVLCILRIGINSGESMQHLMQTIIPYMKYLTRVYESEYVGVFLSSPFMEDIYKEHGFELETRAEKQTFWTYRNQRYLAPNEDEDGLEREEE